MTSRRPLAPGPAVEVEDQQIEQWRRMSSVDKAALISGLTGATFVLARAGLRHRHPGASGGSSFSVWLS